MSTDEPTFWNGEPCKAVRGTGIVVDLPEFPLFWAREEGLIGNRVPVVRVTYGRDRFTLYDKDGVGWAKLTHGRGSPRFGHSNLTVRDFRPVAAGVSGSPTGDGEQR